MKLVFAALLALGVISIAFAVVVLLEAAKLLKELKPPKK